MPDFSQLDLLALAAIFVASGVVVWIAGTRLAEHVDHYADKTGIGRAFAGMLLLGGITSLPEVATVSTASALGNAQLSVNNLLGSAAMNVLLLAVADMMMPRAPLTHMAAKADTLLQGVLGMILLAGVALAITVGDVEIPFVHAGIGTLLLALGCLQALRVASRFGRTHVWDVVTQAPEGEPPAPDRPERSKNRLRLYITVSAACILGAGTLLSLAGDAIATKTGIGGSMVGFVLVALGTSLPELSSIRSAIRLRRYELAIGDIFGTNLFNIQLLFLADLIYRDGPILLEAGAFETIGVSLGMLMTGIFVVGLLERRDRMAWRLGHDSMLAMLVFAGGIVALAQTG